MPGRDDESSRSLLVALEGGWQEHEAKPVVAQAVDGPITRATVRMVRPELPRSLPVSQPNFATRTLPLHSTQAPSQTPPPPEPVPEPVPAPRATSALVLRSRESSEAPGPVVPSPRSQLPPGAGPVDGRLVLVVEPDSARSVAFRLLRDTLLSKGLPRVLAVAGAAAQEGVTTCAVNVALALAEQGSKHVLLVDGNFDAPAVARIFTMDGFAPSTPEADALLPLRLAALMSRFHVAAIVRRNGDPPPRFDKNHFQRALTHLASERYDHVIIDAGPLRAGSSAGPLVSLADATLLAVRAGRTTARALRRATNQIPPGRAIGVTLLDDPQE